MKNQKSSNTILIVTIIILAIGIILSNVVSYVSRMDTINREQRVNTILDESEKIMQEAENMKGEINSLSDFSEKRLKELNSREEELDRREEELDRREEELDRREGELSGKN